ncbi:MAG: putative molybdenum carrier protein [Gammaproteobacteria bacterium]|nr:MAG: putative molybdenum carrier protein [Gammaproteobacteria bacterium]
MISKLISGGQTGVDRATLDVALELGIPCGGWCPRGRRAEDGVIPDKYPLRPTPAADYAQRTARNVRDADATLIISPIELSGGTALTVELARRYHKPYMVVDPTHALELGTVRGWFERYEVKTLNCAGPRESGYPGIYDQAVRFLRTLLDDGAGGKNR